MLVITRGKSRCHPATGQPLNDQVIPFVEQLTDPGTSVELWKAAMTTTSEGDTVVVDVDVMHRRPHIERTWRAFTLAWSSSDVRATFDFVGFAAVIWELKSGKQNGAG